MIRVIPRGWERFAFFGIIWAMRKGIIFAWCRGWIDDRQLKKLAEGYGKSSYGRYLKGLSV